MTAFYLVCHAIKGQVVFKAVREQIVKSIRKRLWVQAAFFLFSLKVSSLGLTAGAGKVTFVIFVETAYPK